MNIPVNKPLVIGITGGIGSGKTAVTDYFARQGIAIIDADIAARMVVEPGQPALDAIALRFGDTLLLPDKTLNRRKLREIIFNDIAEKEWLEKLLHPMINRLLEKQLAEAQSPYVILVSPLLVETSQHELADRVLVVDTSEAIQLERSMARDTMTEAQALKIIRSQSTREHRLGYADDVVDNSSTLEHLHESLKIYHQNYLVLSRGCR
ncbi:dephospho-CoA kinase [Endozoicomonas sp. Mp262]|uniref:dephospho-CoA kinase n=1 Tax=Endozoicomonas sp. Mp262 TaxID=2919499 RepID=UPI0021D9A000